MVDPIVGYPIWPQLPPGTVIPVDKSNGSDWTRFTLTFDETCTDVVVDMKAPESAEMIALCTEINNFWCGAECRLDDAGDDVVKAVLTMLCRCALVEEIISSQGAVHTFAVQGQEGWPKLDGSEGIKLVRVEQVNFEGDVSISSKKVKSPTEM
jgi:hypothetical protein